MAWSILLVAGLLEVGCAIGLKYTDGFSKLFPSVLTLAAMAGGVILLGVALKTLPIGTAYAVWTGIGAVGPAALGIILFGKPAAAFSRCQHGTDCRRHCRAEVRVLTRTWKALTPTRSAPQQSPRPAP